MMLMRPAFWRSQGQRFVGRDHVRVELRPIARRATREIARAMIGPTATDAMLDQVAQQSAGSPLFAEELGRVVAAGKDMGTAPTIEAAIQVSLDALEEGSREAVVRASVFGMSLWDAGLAALGVPEVPASIRRLVAAELLVELPASRFSRGPASTCSSTRWCARSPTPPRATIAGGSSTRGRRGGSRRWGRTPRPWRSTSISAASTRRRPITGRSRRAGRSATNSLREAVTMADRALTFAVDKPTAFARAVLLDEAYSRLDARASERDSAIRAMGENVFDEASELRTLGARARYDDACASGTDIEDHASAASAKSAPRSSTSSTRRRAARRRWRTATRSPAAWPRPSARRRTCST